MADVTVWCPGHVSAVFAPGGHSSQDIVHLRSEVDGGVGAGRDEWERVLTALTPTGSIGAGFSVTKGCLSRAITMGDGGNKSGDRVHRYEYGDTCLEIATNLWGPTSHYAMRMLTVMCPVNARVVVDTRPEMPLMAGFGMSASAVLSQLFALKYSLSLPIRDDEIIKIAHASEILASTGLGDIAGMGGGLEVREKVGIGAEAKVHHIPYEGRVSFVLLSDPIATSSVISHPGAMERIKAAGTKVMPDILSHLENNEGMLEALAQASYTFTMETGILGEAVNTALLTLKESGIVAGGIMIGPGIWSPEPISEVISALDSMDIIYERSLEMGIYNGPNFQIYGTPSIQD